MKFQTPHFTLNEEDAIEFATRLDSNPAHLSKRSNLILPENSVSGLYAVAMANQQLLRLPIFRNVLCATSLDIRWVQPFEIGISIYIRGSYNEVNDPKRTGVVRRISNCEILTSETEEVKATFTIKQLLSKAEE